MLWSHGGDRVPGRNTGKPTNKKTIADIKKQRSDAEKRAKNKTKKDSQAIRKQIKKK